MFEKRERMHSNMCTMIARNRIEQIYTVDFHSKCVQNIGIFFCLLRTSNISRNSMLDAVHAQQRLSFKYLTVTYLTLSSQFPLLNIFLFSFYYI